MAMKKSRCTVNGELLGEKRRPALVLASWPVLNTPDYLLCLTSSQLVSDPYLVPLAVEDVQGGSLYRMSYLRPTYLFTVGESRIVRKIGSLTADKLLEAADMIKDLL